MAGRVDGPGFVFLVFNSKLKRVPVDDQEVVPESERLMGGL
jgi:hypothetical protein